MLETPFYELLNFSFSGPSNFWIFRKLIHKSVKKLKQAPSKKALVIVPVLLLPDFTKPFCIETDASEFGVGVVLMQDHHPIAFVSKALGSKMRWLSTYEKECVAILLVMEQWRYYLQLAVFYI
jgi:hypothetical protein